MKKSTQVQLVSIVVFIIWFFFGGFFLGGFSLAPLGMDRMLNVWIWVIGMLVILFAGMMLTPLASA